LTSAEAIVDELRAEADASRLPGMARVGIDIGHALGVSIPRLRALARRIGNDHDLALSLWGTGVHEARILASMIDEPASVTLEQMEAWASDFTSWDLCDQVCGNLFGATSHAHAIAREWVGREDEFVKRAGFALIAERAVRDKRAPDSVFQSFFPAIRRGSKDERNYVKKAVSWALRQIGKRNPSLNSAAIAEAEPLLELDSSSARWIARDVLRELRSAPVQSRLNGR
jgi:3-methyladenine DNA glycosylase AlkD